MRSRFVALAIATTLVALAATPAVSAEVTSPSVQIGWSPSSGPVQSYVVYESRNGGGFIATTTTGATRATISGEPGDVVLVRILAMGNNGSSQLIFSPISETSEPIEFVSPELPPSDPPGGDPDPPSDPPGGDPDPPPPPSSAPSFAVGATQAAGNEVLQFPVAGDAAIKVADDRLIGFSRDARPVYCNLDGDDAPELVVGSGAGSGHWVSILDDRSTGHALLASTSATWWTAKNKRKKKKKLQRKKKFKKLFTYARYNGETHPTCGDFDGDGLDEVIVGLGALGWGWANVHRGRRGGLRRLVDQPRELLRRLDPSGCGGRRWRRSR